MAKPVRQGIELLLALRCPRPQQRIVTEAVMIANRRPLPDDLDALKEIIGGRPADPQSMQRLMTCNLVEELDGTAILTSSGIEAAASLAPTK